MLFSRLIRPSFLSNPSHRYRDAPDQRDYDWDQLSANVIGGIAVSLSLGFLAGAGALMVVGSTTLGISVAVGGTWYVGTQAVADVLGGRVSSSDAYLRKALAGSAVGFFSGSSSLAMAGAGLGQMIGIAFAEGAFGSGQVSRFWREAIVDAKANIILGPHTSNNACDQPGLIPAIENTEKTYGSLAGFQLGADAGFFSAENIAYAEGKRVNYYASYPEAKSPYAKDKFKYDEASDAYTCPGETS